MLSTRYARGAAALAAISLLALAPLSAEAVKPASAHPTVKATVKPALPAPRVQGAACTSDDGVTVVVDFRNLPNQQGKRMNLVRIGCAEQPVGDGFDALLGAGFAVDPTVPFVCTIDARPLDGDCVSHAYWAYAHGTRGHRWHYATSGAGDWNPPAGSLEGWSWSPYGHEPSSWSYPRVSPRELFPR